jgi:hypothetical protein
LPRPNYHVSRKQTKVSQTAKGMFQDWQEKR